MTAEDEVAELRKRHKGLQRTVSDLGDRLSSIEPAARTLVDALIKEDTCPHVATQKLIEALDE